MACGDNLFYRNMALFVKAESVYGTDPTPDGTNAILCRDVTINTFQGNTEEIDYIKPYLGSGKMIHTGPHSTVSFTVDLAGSGTAGDAPAFGDLLKACKMTETVDPGVDVTYAPNTSGTDSCAAYFFIDGVLHAIVGMRGTFTMDFSKEALPKLQFTFTGLRVAPSAAAAPSPTGYTDFVEPVPVNDTYSSAFSLLSYSPNLEALSIDIGNNVVYRNLVGCESVTITDRAMTGSVTVEEPPLGSHDYDADVFNHTLGDLALTHGTTAGNIVAIASSTCQAIQPQRSDSDGIVALQMGLRLPPSAAGNDELSVVFS